MNRRQFTLGSAAAGIMSIIGNVKSRGAAVEPSEAMYPHGYPTSLPDPDTGTYHIWPSATQEKILFPTNQMGEYGNYKVYIDSADGVIDTIYFFHTDTGLHFSSERDASRYTRYKEFQASIPHESFTFKSTLFKMRESDTWDINESMWYGGIYLESADKLNSSVLETFELFVGESLRNRNHG